MALRSYRILHGETRMLVRLDLPSALRSMEEAVASTREKLVDHIRRFPDFRWSLEPLQKPKEPLDPVISEMYEAGRIAGVGPFASVAGAIAQAATIAAVEAGARNVLAENGGDICLYGDRSYLVAIYAGTSPFSERIALRIKPGRQICGLCTSSSTVGESVSFGEADAVVVYHPSSAIIADAAATSICNEVRGREGMSTAVSKAKEIGEIGAVIIRGEEMAFWGNLPQIVRISNAECDLVAKPETHSRAPDLS